MSITHAQRVRLGIFIICGTVFLVLLIVIPLGLSMSDKKTYFSYFEGESLSGLEQGSIVKFRGIPIGKVGTITYDPKDLSRVKVHYEIDRSFPMKSDMFAQTDMIGITGLKYVEIMGGSNEADLLKDRSEIPSRPSLMANITGKSEVILAKIEVLLNNLTMLTHPDSLATFRKILKNAEDVSLNTKLLVDQVGYHMKSIAASSNVSMQNVAQITESIKKVTKDISDSLKMGKIMRIVQHIDSTSRYLKDLSGNMDLTIKQSREDISVSMRNMREAMENANELSRLLLENPSLIIKGENVRERSKK